MRLANTAQPNKSLTDGIRCLELLASSTTPLGSREIARRLGIEHTKVNRLLGTLAHSGMAFRTTARKYTAGAGLHVLSAMSLRRSGILRPSIAVLERLGQETKMDVALGVLWQTQVWYLYYGGASKTLEQSIAGNIPYSAERSSLGLMLLSKYNNKEVKEIYSQSPEGSQVDIDYLLKLLKEVRSQNFALNHSGSIAVEVGSPAIASLAFAGGNSQSSSDKALIKQLPILEASAAEISERIEDYQKSSHFEREVISKNNVRVV
jgi:DNA-binding IclR family transcriptional regulator